MISDISELYLSGIVVFSLLGLIVGLKILKILEESRRPHK
jgi:hypothetical protein